MTAYRDDSQKPSALKPVATSPEPLLVVRNLNAWFPMSYNRTAVLDGVSFELTASETLGVLGESGCGKSLLALALMRLQPRNAEVNGEVLLQGKDLFSLSERAMRGLRGRMLAMIYQDPLMALNPGRTVGRQLRQTCRRFGHYAPRELLELVHLDGSDRMLRAYPHELSGGQRQRVLIALGLAGRPALLIADEPTTALDVTVEAQIMELLRELRSELDFSTILISHDVGLLAENTDRIAVMYAGQLVETGPVEQVLYYPSHHYTIGLLDSARSLEAGHGRLSQIPGTVPPPTSYPPGCRFSSRCRAVSAVCMEGVPELSPSSTTSHLVACFHRVEGPSVGSQPSTEGDAHG